MPELIALLERALPALAALAGIGLGAWIHSRRDRDADRRARRDAKLARLRAAFVPVVRAAWAFQTGASELFMSSISREAMTKIIDGVLESANEARIQLVLEDDVRDVFEELEKVRSAYLALHRDIVGKEALMDAEEKNRAFEDVCEGSLRIVRLATAHLQRVESSATSASKSITRSA